MNDDRYFELPAPEVFGPQGAHVVALLDRARHLTPDEASELDAELDAAWDVAWDAVRDAAWDAAWDAELDAALDAARDAVRDATRGVAWDAARGVAWDAAWDATWDATWDAACGLVVRDLITTEDYDTLTRTWREVIGPIHPDDPDMRGDAP